MNTNFFSSIAAMNVAGDWKINIANNTTGQWIVSVLLFNEQTGDEAAKLIPPFILKGTADELDEGFFSAIEQPLRETAGLHTNMEDYLKQREEAKLQSQMEKDKADKAEKERRERQKKVEEAMKKVDELETEGKFRDAWMKVPDPADHPEQADLLTKRKSELAKKFAPDLFNVEPQNT